MVPPGLGPLPQTGLTHLKLVKMRHAFKGTHHASPLEKSCLAPPGFLLLGPKEKESYRTGGGRRVRRRMMENYRRGNRMRRTGGARREHVLWLLPGQYLRGLVVPKRTCGSYLGIPEIP